MLQSGSVERLEVGALASWSLSQPEFSSPEMNQAEPLSATMAPYFLRVSATALACGAGVEVSTEL